MADHFSTIGFSINPNSQEEFREIVSSAYKNGEKIKTDKGTYSKWSSKTGAELWVAVNDNNGNLDFLNLSPAFSGKSSRHVKLHKPLIRFKDTLEGSFFAESERIEMDPHSEGFPFLFDVPDFYTLPEYEFPKECDIQLSAFAHQITCFDTEKEFYGDRKKPHLASQSFIPSGLFFPGGKKREVVVPEGIFAGIVLEWKKLKNELTGNSFLWMLVKTLSGEIDVVCDPSILNKDPKKGGVILGTFWLSGRILDSK